MPGEHARVRRAVRLVTRAARSQPHWRMLEGKRPALVAMAFQTDDLVGGGPPQVVGRQVAVGIMTIRARYRSFLQFVPVWTLKLRPYLQMATLAKGVGG